MKNRRERIEASPEIESLLLSIAQKLDADAAILYKFIDKTAVEGAELLELISKSNMVSKNPNFFKDVLINTLPGYTEDLSNILESYSKGAFDTLKNKNLLDFLKDNIKVLRFYYFAEIDGKKSNWNFDYRKRPPKYLVFSKKLLQPDYHNIGIAMEGVTSFFCRTRLRDYIENEENSKTRSAHPAYLYQTRDEINIHRAHGRMDRNDPNVYSGRPKTPILELPGINQNVKLLTALPVSGIVLNTVSKD